MKAHYHRSRKPGQSLPFIALIIVVLFGMVGLAVDVGSTYAAQRNAVRAANAAALSGMKMMINNVSDVNVRNAINASLESNGIQAAGLGGSLTSSYKVNAQYLDANGDVMLHGCEVGSCTGDALPPAGAAYIRVNISGLNETYFARVVNRPDLPVDAQSFSGRCSPVTDVFPIAINSKNLDAEGFRDPNDPNIRYGLYTSGDHEDVWLRRIYLKNDVSIEGDFSFLSWQPGATLPDMLTGDGSLDLGFTEATWPEGFAQEAFPGYPVEPNQLNAGNKDWVHGLTSFDVAAVQTKLQPHITNRTVMYLPIFNDPNQVWPAAGPKYQIEKMGAFLLDGVGTETRPGGETLYLDLAYIGDATEVPCTLTSSNVPGTQDNPNPKTYNVVGRVLLQPVHNIIDEGGRKPVSFIVVLDTSGSMNWNFQGQGRKNGQEDGKIYQCGATTDPDVTRKSCKGPDHPWVPLDDRRIYTAKQAVMGFIDKMDENDQMRIIGFGETSDSWEYGTPEGKLDLKDDVLRIGRSGGDPYKPSGGTPSASTLWKTHNMLETDSRAQDGVTAPNGKEYKRVVVFITDGVANILMTSGGGTKGHDDQFPPESAGCSGHKAENVYCQIDGPGYPDRTDGLERPITAMVTQGTRIREGSSKADPTDDVALYVMAMAGVPKTGLTEVASQSESPYYMEATEATLVGTMLDSIFIDATTSGCQPGGGTTWIDKIPNDNLPDTDVPGFEELSSSVFGFVYLYDEAGNPLPDGKHKISIVEDTMTVNGGMVFRVDDLAPGTYQMRAFVGYKGVDEVSRSYSKIYDPYKYSRATVVTFKVIPSNTLNQTIAIDPTYLQLDGTVCPPAAMP